MYDCNPALLALLMEFEAVAALPVYIVILFFLPETLRCLVGNGSAYSQDSGLKSWFVLPRLRQKPLVEDGKFPKPPKPSLKSMIKTLVFVPNLIVSSSSALNFAGLSCMYVLFPRVWQVGHGFSGAETGYAFLAPGKSSLRS